MFFKKECFAQEQEYRMVFLCVHKREHQVPENSIPVEYRIKDEVFIPFIRMKLGDKLFKICLRWYEEYK